LGGGEGRRALQCEQRNGKTVNTDDRFLGFFPGWIIRRVCIFVVVLIERRVDRFGKSRTVAVKRSPGVGGREKIGEKLPGRPADGPIFEKKVIKQATRGRQGGS